MTEEEQIVIQEIDARFVNIGEALKTLNECILTLDKRLKDVEKIVSAIVEAHTHLQTVDKVVYKPPGGDEYMSVKDNLDLIYDRLETLESNT